MSNFIVSIVNARGQARLGHLRDTVKKNRETHI